MRRTYESSAGNLLPDYPPLEPEYAMRDIRSAATPVYHPAQRASGPGDMASFTVWFIFIVSLFLTQTVFDENTKIILSAGLTDVYIWIIAVLTGLGRPEL